MEIQKKYFVKHIINFYLNIVSYLESCEKQFNEIISLKCIYLKKLF